MEKKIIIVEGPAGSGKSTLISSWTDRIHQDPKLEKDPPRDYGETSALKSMMKDHFALMKAFDYKGDRPVVIDRCFFSQYVYESIRSGRETQYLYTVEAFMNAIRDMSFEYAVRSFQPVQRVSVDFVWVTPKSYDQLLQFRIVRGKEYPFPVAEEFLRYKSLYQLVGGYQYIPERTNPDELFRLITQ